MIIRNCIECGENLAIYTGRGTPTKYCPSEICRGKARERYNENRRNKVKKPKYCLICGIELINRRSKWCAVCIPSRFYYRANYEYGLIGSEFDKLIKITGNLCSICKNRPWNAIDHDHITGKVRGLLCRQCNFLLGFSGDDTGILQEAINYLLKAELENVETTMARPLKNPPAQGGGRFAGMKNKDNETMAPGLVGPGKSAMTRKGKSAPATKSKTKKGA